MYLMKVLSLDWVVGSLALLVIVALEYLGWVVEQALVLHYAATVMLLALAGVLAARFVRKLARRHEELWRLSRERAVEEERQRLKQEMHDGLGSQLFLSWFKLQSGPVSYEEMKEILKTSIAEMRLALDGLASSDEAALANFRYRWEAELRGARIESFWQIDEFELPTDQRWHVLRILQEALTNVLKHANASEVTVRAIRDVQGFRFEVSDNGRERVKQKVPAGIGIRNMRARALSIGATFEFDHGIAGTVVKLLVPSG